MATLQISYQSNDLTTLKKQALIAKDINFLRRIRAYEAEDQSQTKYYSLLSEGQIRDKNGKVADLEMLPFPRWKAFEYFLPIRGVQLYEEIARKPGHLYESINQNSWREHSILILEVPDTIKFPLPDHFDWFQYCLDWLKEYDYVCNPGARHKLNGIEANILFNSATPKDPSKNISLVSSSQLSDAEIQEVLEFQSTNNSII